MSGSSDLIPIVSKIFCSSSLTTLTVRKRPRVVNGGGFAVTDRRPKTIFTVDGCGVIGSKGQLLVRDEDGASILRIQKKGGVVQALSTGHQWKGFADNQGTNKLVFSLKESRACFAKNERIRICTEPRSSHRDWDYEVHGSFPDKDCSINDRRGAIVAEVIVSEMMESKEIYQLIVRPGYDQAFVVGVIAVLDSIHGESTSC
ncbi:uncharacterized protein A4U43_C06F4030 [Asparagus officinalis]|uniref:Protein LURP-one-related 6 n=1 Tax=Asparagus officinalis TaxID=4686 RepID=A0A5P1EJE3_ASPOF|nr:protein LURP-one-related 6-like [Asparagus officinalis]ONK66088.1 uncharacterized protein A4U43_C06F4030 [Asparagus officinalis]